jgi:hypothetical protein
MNQEKDTVGTSADSHSKDRSVKTEVGAGKGKLAEFAETAKSAGKAQLDSGLAQAASQVSQVAKALDETAGRLKQEHHETLAAYTSQVASSITSVADRLRNSSVDELAAEARQLARSNAALFLVGSVAIGFGLSRFLKASSRVSRNGGQMRQDAYGSSYGDSREPTHDWESGSSGTSSGSSGSGSSSGSRSSSGSGGIGSAAAAGDELQPPETFPEMNTPSVAPGGTVGGSRTNQVSGGSHG